MIPIAVHNFLSKKTSQHYSSDEKFYHSSWPQIISHLIHLKARNLSLSKRIKMKEKIFHRISTKSTISLIPLSLLFLAASSDPVPTPWPLQFHSILFMNNTKGILQVVDLWYDWPNGRNFNIIQNQLGKKLYDLEWGNGTSYYYTLDENKECTTRHFPVGILRPNWLDGANYIGQVYTDGFLCNVWEKVDFIWYYEDVVTKRPVYWAFFTGMIAHVMTFEVGQVLDDPNWQAPIYCFQEEEANHGNNPVFDSPFDRSFIREFLSIPMVI